MFLAFSRLLGSNRSQHHFLSVPPFVPAGYGIEFAYVILSYDIVLKLGDPSPVLKQGEGETKKNKIQFGILGCAKMARKISGALLLSPNSIISASGSLSLNKAPVVAFEKNFPKSAEVYGSYDVVSDDPNVEAVYAPIPTSLHLQWDFYGGRILFANRWNLIRVRHRPLTKEAVSMEEDTVCYSSEFDRLQARPLTKDAVLLLHNLVTFESARSLFGVDLQTLKEKLFEFNILVWSDPNGLPVRINGGDYKIYIFINKLHTVYSVKGTDSFSYVRGLLEHDLPLSPGYELTYEKPQTSTYELLETDLDWHYAVEYSKVRSYHVRLNLKSDDPRITCYMNAYDQEFFHESDDEPYDENDFCCNEDHVASYASASHMTMTASDKDASASRVAMLNLVLDVVPFVHDSLFINLFT
ncbi:uncharacterized oxidoreductase-like protein [Tanacetum coccineum]